MNNAQLHLGMGKDRLDGFWQPLETIDAGDKAILDTPALEFIEYRQPELGTFRFGNPQAQ